MKNAKMQVTATFSGGKGDSSPSCCHFLSVMTSTNDGVRNDYSIKT
jgi:hypothetical protein